MSKTPEAIINLIVAIGIWSMPPYLLATPNKPETYKELALLTSLLASLSSLSSYRLLTEDKLDRYEATIEGTAVNYLDNNSVSQLEPSKSSVVEIGDSKILPETTTQYVPSIETNLGSKHSSAGKKTARTRSKKATKPKQELAATSKQELNPNDLLPMTDDYQREGWDIIKDEKWLVGMLLAKPILVLGGMGAGKTTFTNNILYARRLFFDHDIYITDPHTSTWPAMAKVWGQPKGNEKEPRWSEIDEGLVQYYNLTLDMTKSKTYVFDEVTIYDGNTDKKLMGELLKHALSFTRKYPMWPILISHNDTMSTLGGGKGGWSKMLEGMVQVTLYPTRDALGNLKPLLKGKVENLLVGDDGLYITQEFSMPKKLLQLKSLVDAREAKRAKTLKP